LNFSGSRVAVKPIAMLVQEAWCSPHAGLGDGGLDGEVVKMRRSA